MSYVKRAETILTNVVSQEENGEEVEKIDKSLVKLLNIPYDSIYNTLFKQDYGRHSVVYYPGMSIDIFRPLIYTNFKKLIAIDLIDSNFFPTMQQYKKISQKLKIQLYFNEIINELGKILFKLENKNAIKSIAMKGKKLEIKFIFQKISREIVVYIENANKFIPKELKKATTLFLSSFCPCNKILEKLPFKKVISDEKYKFLKDKQKTAEIDVYGVVFDSYNPVEYGKSVYMDKNSPFILIKAENIKRTFFHTIFSVYKI